MSAGKRNEDTVLIIMGSARTDGNTAQAVQELCQRMGQTATMVDLVSLAIEPFDYSRTQSRDDFHSVIDQMIASRSIVFATPVYWYAMSGVMKIFFDRFTDLLLDSHGRKMGRALAGREVWLLASGTDETLPTGFQEPFARTAAYFDMQWREAFYVRSLKGESPSAPELDQVGILATRLMAR